jgi:endonuclease VIII
MPEGDTILRAARTLGRALEGRRILRSEGADVSERTVTRVEARGKNLLVHFDDGRALHTHMRMTGSWHIYRPGERWQRPAWRARVVLETEAYVAVCFDAPVARMLASGGDRRDPHLATLGPDILSPDFDAREAVERLRLLGHLPIGEALVAQNAAAGIGNVHKSETLFLCGVDPFRQVRDLSDDALLRILAKARELMQSSVDGRIPAAERRALGRGARSWVYLRSGRPCRRCGTAIRMRRQGSAGRSTYWCPSCQPRAAGAPV